jgi:hypothetical protein
MGPYGTPVIIPEISAALCGHPGDVRLQVTWNRREEIKRPRPDMRLQRRTNGESLWVAENQEAFWFWRPGVSLFLNLVSGEGNAEISGHGEWLEVMLISYFYKFLTHQGILLHASGVIRQGQAYLFPGPSGAGKSTIAGLAPSDQVLDDDTLGLVLPEGQGATAYNLPLLRYGAGPQEPHGAPLKALYFPVQSTENRLEPLTPRETLSRLLPCIKSFTGWLPRRQKVFDLSSQLAERSPGFALHFRPEPQFWQALDGS